MIIRHADDLIRFLDASPTSFHAVRNIIGTLEEKGFSRLEEDKRWDLKPGTGYYLVRDGAAAAAFRTGLEAPGKTGIRFAGAHTDSPGLKIKPQSVTVQGNTISIGVEVYGGPILSSWIDRDLSIAGRVMFRTRGNAFSESKLVNLEKPVGIIPNLAVHLNRDINKGFEYNKQTHLPVVVSGQGKTLKEFLSLELNTDEENIGESDLYFYGCRKGKRIGGEDGMITSARIDNLSMCHAVLCALAESVPGKGTAAALFFDNEETGSRTYRGADSGFLNDLIERIVGAAGGDREDLFTAKARSFLISADGAHASHPAYTDKHDAKYAPELNKGPVIKINAGNKYATSAATSEYFQRLCNSADVPFQKFITRSDLPCGSTIGPVSSALSSLKTVDVGNPMWAMHSIRETCGVRDHYSMIKVLSGFYNGEWKG